MWEPCEYSKSPAVNALLNIAREIHDLTEAVRAVNFLRDDLKKGVEVLGSTKEAIETHGETLKKFSETIETYLESIDKSVASIDKTLYRRP